MIEEAWKHVHGRYPGPRNSNAAKAALALWRVSDCPDTGWGDKPVTGWRIPFATARKTPAEDIRTEFRRHIQLNALHDGDASCPGT
jgi:hypothetical protein